MALATAACLADTLTVGTSTHEGRFTGFRDKQFLFATREGRLLRADRAQVRGLALDQPLEAQLTATGKGKTSTVKILGYERGRFAVEQNGRRSQVIGMRVERVDVPSAGAAAAAGGDAPAARPPLDVAALQRRPNLSAAQRTALGRYRTARKAYDLFLTESSALVARMDRAKGKQREALLNQLRLRKNQEQPLIRQLARAEADVRSAFPNAGADRPPPPGPPARDSALGGLAGLRPSEQKPLVVEHEVMIIDVSGLKRMPNLTAEQTAAIRGYGAAAERIQKATDHAAITRAAAELQRAEAVLRQAFPQVKFDP